MGFWGTRIMIRVALLVTGSFLVDSCAFTSTAKLPVARPGVIIQGVTKKQILIALINEMVPAGTHLRSLDETSAVFVRKSDAASKITPNRAGQEPGSEIRLTFDLIQSGEGISVLASGAIVTNPGRPSEKAIDATSGGIAQQMKAMLQRLKTHLEN